MTFLVIDDNRHIDDDNFLKKSLKWKDASAWTISTMNENKKTAVKTSPVWRKLSNDYNIT